jgi:4-hydroxyphenylacetate 3-monooxygenase
MAKSAQDHLRSLDDGRRVYLDGKAVNSVPEDPGFRNAARSVAALYDFQHLPENLELMTMELPDGTRVNRAWQQPRNYAELVRRREAMTAWAELHHGFMGRSPDHLASTFAAFAMGLHVYDRSPGGRAGALKAYYEYARANDLYISYVIIDPQGDRSKGASEGGNADLALRIVDEDREGVTIRGAKMLGTGAVLSNEVLVSTLRPLKPEEDAYAFTAAVPINHQGVNLLSRRSYEKSATSAFDHPLSWRLDENDALLYFEDAKIPWDRVFVHRDPVAQLAQWHDTPAHMFQNYQSCVRLMVKTRFLIGLARKITETIGTINFPSVRETLGDLASEAAMVEAFVYGMEAKGWSYGEFYLPDRALLYTAQVQFQKLYPRLITTLRELAGGGVLMLPSAVSDFDSPEIRRMIERTQFSAIGAPRERVQFLKLVWDAIGSEFASRHLQYEIFYSGPRTTTTGMAFKTFDWDAAAAPVSRALGGDGARLPEAVE